MMRKICLIILAVFVVSIANSQTKPHFISVNIGASVPMGDYNSTDGDNESAGFAKTGVNFDEEKEDGLSKLQ